MNARSLRARVALTTFVLLAAVMSAVLWKTLASYRAGAATLIAEIESSKLATLDVFAEGALLTGDFAQFQAQLESLASEPDVIEAMLLDETALVVAGSEPVKVGKPSAERGGGPAYYWQTQLLGSPSRPSGTLAIRFSTARRDALEKSVRDQALLAMLVGTLFCAAASMLAAQLLTNRIHRIGGAAQRVSAGDLQARSGLAGNDEIGELGQAFDRMVDRLAVAQSELVTHQAGLEQLVEQRTRQLHAAQTSLLERERLSALGELTARVNHELRNPLGTIANSLNALRRIEELSDWMDPTLARADRAIVRCVRIIDDFREYAEPPALEKSHIDLEQLVRQVLENPSWPDDVDVNASFAPVPLVWADPQRLAQALTQIVRNAAQAVAETKRDDAKASVAIRSIAREDSVLLEVTDNAGGIDPQHIDSVLTPLFSTRAFGIGLGLPIARQITEMHGGSLHIESTAGGGTTVSIALPITGQVATQSASEG